MSRGQPILVREVRVVIVNYGFPRVHAVYPNASFVYGVVLPLAIGFAIFTFRSRAPGLQAKGALVFALSPRAAAALRGLRHADGDQSRQSPRPMPRVRKPYLHTTDTFLDGRGS